MLIILTPLPGVGVAHLRKALRKTHGWSAFSAVDLSPPCSNRRGLDICFFTVDLSQCIRT